MSNMEGTARCLHTVNTPQVFIVTVVLVIKPKSILEKSREASRVLCLSITGCINTGQNISSWESHGGRPDVPFCLGLEDG